MQQGVLLMLCGPHEVTEVFTGIAIKGDCTFLTVNTFYMFPATPGGVYHTFMPPELAAIRSSLLSPIR